VNSRAKLNISGRRSAQLSPRHARPNMAVGTDPSNQQQPGAVAGPGRASWPTTIPARTRADSRRRFPAPPPTRALLSTTGWAVHRASLQWAEQTIAALSAAPAASPVASGGGLRGSTFHPGASGSRRPDHQIAGRTRPGFAGVRRANARALDRPRDPRGGRPRGSHSVPVARDPRRRVSSPWPHRCATVHLAPGITQRRRRTPVGPGTPVSGRGKLACRGRTTGPSRIISA